MHFSLVLLAEGSPEVGSIPIFRVVDPELNRIATEKAISRAESICSVLEGESDAAHAYALSEVERLRSILEVMNKELPSE